MADENEIHSDRAWLRQVIAVFLIALMIRLMHFGSMANTPVFQVLIGDAWQYDQWGQQIAGGQWIGTEVFYQTPLYPYFLGVIYTVCGHSLWAVRIAQALLGGLACSLLARAGTRFFNFEIGWLSGLLLALYPPAMFFDGILQKASLDLVLMCLMLWMISRIQHRLTLSGSIAIGSILGMLILNRENAWVFLPVLLAWLFWLGWKSDPKAIRAAFPTIALIVGLCLVLIPVGLRNYCVGGDFLLTTSQMGPNFYIGNHRGSEGKYVPLRFDRGHARFERTDARVMAEQAEGRSLSPREVSQFWMRRTLGDIRADPIRWIKLLCWKWFLTWNQLEVIDSEGIRGHAVYSPVLKVFGHLLNFGIVTSLGAAGLWLTRHKWPTLAVLYALGLTFAFAVTLFFVFARYRYPLVPIVILFAAACLVEVWRGMRSSESEKWLRLTIAFALGGLVAIATCWPMNEHHNDDVTYFNVGSALNELGRYEEAMKQFDTALNIKPNFAAAYANMGVAAMGQKEYRQAVSFLTKAVEFDRRSATAYANLGQAYIELNRDDEAEQTLLHALELDPYLIQAHIALATIETKRGNFKKAVEIAKRAVDLDRLSVEAYIEYGKSLLANKQYSDAVDAFETVLKLRPNNVTTVNNLAWLLATGPEEVRNGSRAVELALQANQSARDENPDLLDTLAAAYAESGDFDRAAELADRARKLYEARGDDAMSRMAQHRLELYRRKVPYRKPVTE